MPKKKPPRSYSQVRQELIIATRTREAQNEFLKKELQHQASGKHMGFRRSLGLQDRGTIVRNLNQKVTRLRAEMRSMEPPLQREKDR